MGSSMGHNSDITTMNICYSGGSVGADYEFGECAKRVGHQVIHYSFQGHKTPCDNLVKLNLLQLNECHPHLKMANRYLKRRYPTNSAYVDQLLQRDYYQIKETDWIYAVSELEKNGHVKGGTGWAVMMGILKGVNGVYVYDVNDDNWYSLEYFDKENNIINWELIPYPSFPTGKYTGIGKRDLPENGRKAILNLYNLGENDEVRKDS